MILITSPSKTQKFSGRLFPHHSLPVFLEKSELIIKILRTLKKEEISSLMKTSEKLTESTYSRIHQFSSPFTPENGSQQALFTFQGDAYSAITADSYSETELQHAHNHLLILSGLYGMLRPLDLMQAYRLEMATKLEIREAKAKNLYQFWQQSITEKLNGYLAKHGDKTLVNLASTEYSRVVDRKQLEGRIVDIIFKQQAKGELKTIPIHAKRARGLMIHYVITEQITESERLKDFTLGDYSYCKTDSGGDKWVFTQA